MDIYELPTGNRINVSSDICIDGVFQGRFTYDATATNRIKFMSGDWRRLFVDMSIELLPGIREIWLQCNQGGLTLKEATTQTGILNRKIIS